MLPSLQGDLPWCFIGVAFYGLRRGLVRPSITRVPGVFLPRQPWRLACLPCVVEPSLKQEPASLLVRSWKHYLPRGAYCPARLARHQSFGLSLGARLESTRLFVPGCRQCSVYCTTLSPPRRMSSKMVLQGRLIPVATYSPSTSGISDSFGPLEGLWRHAESCVRPAADNPHPAK